MPHGLNSLNPAHFLVPRSPGRHPRAAVAWARLVSFFLLPDFLANRRARPASLRSSQITQSSTAPATAAARPGDPQPGSRDRTPPSGICDVPCATDPAPSDRLLPARARLRGARRACADPGGSCGRHGRTPRGYKAIGLGPVLLYSS